MVLKKTDSDVQISNNVKTLLSNKTDRLMIVEIAMKVILNHYSDF